MKLLVVLACVALAAATEQELWEKFKAEHGKVYKSPIQERVRFIIFKEALKTIEAHNAKFESGESSYKMGINQFADITPAEFKAMLNYKKVDLPITGFFVPPKNYTAPTSIDWRNKGAVLGVKDQGQCGSCWAFSTTGSLEGQNAIHHSKKISLSEQELVDCSSSYGNEGCNGGDMAAAFQYIHAKGIGTEAGYKYTGKDGTCKHPTRADVKVTGFTRVGATESALYTAVGSVGPISVAMNAELIQYYDSGIFDDSSCSKDLDHGVLAVGYGTESKDYWIIKNSWGASWGEKGYFRLVRNKSNQCGIASDSVYPKIS